MIKTSIIVSALACGLCLARSDEAKLKDKHVTHDTLKYDEILVCGRNAMYLFISIIKGAPLKYEAVNSIPISGDGSSLLSLKQAAINVAGIPTTIRLYESVNLDQVPLPAIIQLYTPGKDGISNEHFDVMYDLDKHWAYTVNGTTGEMQRWSRSKTSRLWTGYALVRERNLFWWDVERRTNYWIFVGIMAGSLCYVKVRKIVGRERPL